MAESKKIGIHLLEDEVANKINKKITLDDLDPSLRTLIQNIGSAPVGYNDSDLRQRIIDIENKMSASTVESDLANLTNRVNKNTNDISDLDNKKIDTTDAETLKKSIIFSDLDSITQEKINTAYSYYQGIMPSGDLNSNADLTTVTAIVNYLKDNMVVKNDLSGYTQNSDVIYKSRLDTVTQSAIDQIVSGGSSGSGINIDLSEYRRRDVPIKTSDLDSVLLAMLKGVQKTEENLEQGILSKSEQIRDSINNISIGQLGGNQPDPNSLYYINYTNAEKGKFTSLEGSKTMKAASFDMYQQRQILKNTGNMMLYDPLDEQNITEIIQTDDGKEKQVFHAINGVSDTYKLVDLLCWLYYDTIGDYQLLSNTFQTKVCENSKDRNVKLDNPEYMGVAYQIFPLMDAIIYLTSRIRNLEAIIAKMSKDNNMKTKYFDSYNNSSSTTIDDNETPDAQNTNIPNRLKANNTSGKF